MSRRQKPRSFKVATGNPGRRPLPPEANLPDTGDCEKPEYILRRQRASDLWDELAPALRLLGTLKKESAYLFAQWCWLQSTFEEAPDAMTASKIAQIRFISSMLGMDPSSQAKFATPKRDSTDPADEFFAGPVAVNE